ncbi:MAG: bifunctional DNA primase/polymerase [Phycisphaerales bacterium]|nr:bifunctional DNA primase/polymerase [Phycisphaerales bacterium]
MTLLETAVRDGHARGWSFTPLRGKVPTLQGWQSRPRESLAQALAWAAAGNVGLRCGAASGGLVVIDADPGADVSALGLPRTVTVLTGRPGGMHFYYKSDSAIRNSAGKLGECIDVRGEGGQVVFPGSVHPDTGVIYRWAPGRAPWEIGVADLPENIVAKLLSERTGATAADPIPAGRRNTELTSVAGRLRRAGLDGPALRAALDVENERCIPPLNAGELDTIAQSVSRYPAGAPAPAEVTSVAVHFNDALDLLLNAAETGRPVVRTLATGCELLDEAGGLACGEYLGLVGSPGVGKSIMADLLTLGALRADPDATALTIALETAVPVRMARVVAGAAVNFDNAGRVTRCVPLGALLRGELTDGARARTHDTARRLHDEVGSRWTFRMNLASGSAIADAVRTARPTVLVVDHVGLLELGDADATTGLDAALGQIVAALRENGTAAVLVHELNKHSLTNGTSIAAPRGSARFASLAGALLAVVRDEDDDGTDPLIVLRLLKCRHGRPGVEQSARLLGGLGHMQLLPGVRPIGKSG